MNGKKIAIGASILGLAGYIAYKRLPAFRNAVNKAASWGKSNAKAAVGKAALAVKDSVERTAGKEESQEQKKESPMG